MSNFFDKCEEWYEYVYPRLKQGKKTLSNEAKDKDRRGKLCTEIYMLKKFCEIGFEIVKPGPKKGDVLAQDHSRTFIIEVYQPDASKSEGLKDIMKRARNRVVVLHIEDEEILKDIVLEGIKIKKDEGQLTKAEDRINILCVDLSDRSLLEQPRILLTELVDDLGKGELDKLGKELKKHLDDWDALNGVILSNWTEDMTEKEGLLIHEDIDKESIGILNEVIHLHEL